MRSSSHKLALLLAASVGLALVSCGSDDDGPSSAAGEEIPPSPVVRATVDLPRASPEGEGAISAVTPGEGAVWVGRLGCVGSVLRIDPVSNEVVATIPVGFVSDIAVGEGAVWVLGGLCPGGEFPPPEDGVEVNTEDALFRIDPESNELVETIRLDVEDGLFATGQLTAGEGGVWISVVDRRHTSGELLRIDPRTGELAARISVRGGAPFNVEIAAGAIWVLREGSRAAHSALLRIEPDTNAVTATLAEGSLQGLAPLPTMAVGDGALWVRGYEGPHRVSKTAIRVDAETNEVVRERLDTEDFWPFAVAEGGVWLLGTTRRGPTLERMDAETLEIGPRVEGKAKGGRFAYTYGAFDPSSSSFWLAQGSSVVRVDLR